MEGDFNSQSETITFAAANTVKISSILFARLGFPFSALRFTKSAGVTAMVLTLSAGVGNMVFLDVTEGGAETLLVEALIDGNLATPTLWHDLTQVAAATNITGAALVDGAYTMALRF